ncbi:unnamed protein product [Chrysoparadoxa australica]
MFCGFAYVMLTTLGGGLIASLLLREVPGAITDDFIFVVLGFWWVVAHRWPTQLLKACTCTVGRTVIAVFVSLGRAHSVMDVIDLGSKVFPASKYYPIAMFGPIIAGAIKGFGGMFLPADRGVQALDRGLPWTIQIAFVSAVFYHLVCHDDFLLGGVLRGISTSDPVTARLIVAVFFLTTQVIQAQNNWQEWNPLSPVHRGLYRFTGLKAAGGQKVLAQTPKDPEPEATTSPSWRGLYNLRDRKRQQILIKVGRYSLIVGALLLFLRSQLPPDTLFVHQQLQGGDYIASCTLFPSLRSCTPTVAVMEMGGSLAVYKGTSPSDSSRELQWKSPAPRVKDQCNGCAVAELMLDGTIQVKGTKQAEKPKVFWQSKLAKGGAAARRYKVEAVAREGELLVYRGGLLQWQSSKSK